MIQTACPWCDGPAVVEAVSGADHGETMTCDACSVRVPLADDSNLAVVDLAA